MFGDRDIDLDQRLQLPQVDVNEIMLDHLDRVELFALRGRIDALLPSPQMADIDLEAETVRQFQTVQALQTKVVAGNDEPNKKASVIQACAVALQMLAKMQSDVFTSERYKRIENLMIKHLKLLPQETAEAFLADYERLVLEMEKS